MERDLPWLDLPGFGRTVSGKHERAGETAVPRGQRDRRAKTTRALTTRPQENESQTTDAGAWAEDGGGWTREDAGVMTSRKIV